MSLLRSLLRPTPVLALILVASSAGALALGAREARASAPASAAEPANDALEAAMRQMNGSLKVLAKGVTAENHDAALAELAKFQTAVITAKGLTPDSAAEIDAAKRPKFVADYHKMLLDVLKLSCDAEVAIVDAKYKDADTLIRNKLLAMKSAGHNKFQSDKNGKDGEDGKDGKDGKKGEDGKSGH